jgi:hypothetical protein
MTRSSFPIVLVSATLLSVACSSTPTTPAAEDAGIDARVGDALGVDAADGDAKPYPLNQVCAPVTLPVGTEDKACSECSQSNCCDTRARLIAFADAQALASCVGDPACDAVCESACFAKYPAPAQALLDHGACKQYLCQGSCISSVNACGRCLADKCLAESLACDLDSGCFVLVSCSKACATQECRDACLVQYPAARDKFTRTLTCSLTRCATECM